MSDIPEKYGEHAPIPDWLRHPLEAVLRDLQHPVEVPLTLAWSATTPDEGYLWIGEEGQTDLTGIAMTRADVETMAVRLADELSDQLLPETTRAWGEARPACKPGHPHPAEAALIERDGWWICPVDRDPLARIGARYHDC